MNTIKIKSKLYLIVTFTIMGLLLNSATILAAGKVLYEKNYLVKANEMLSVKISSADVKVRSWDKNEVYILVEGKESVNKYFDFEFLYEAGVVKVSAEKKSDRSSWSNWDWSNDFKIIVKVPNAFNIDVKTSGGDIEINGIEGKLSLATSGGDIELKNSKGSLFAKTSGGDIEIKGLIGNSILKTSGGDIEAKEVSGSLEAKTSGGDIQLNVSKGKIVAGTSGGDIQLDYKGENKGVELYTSGGSISVKIPYTFAADVLFKVSGGSIENKFKNTKPSNISKFKFEGNFNDGGATFSAKTSGGSIYIN